jgi:transposase
MANLPRYAPELNPDEQVWNHAKARLGKKMVNGKAQMRSEMFSILRSIQRCAELVRSFFQLPDTRHTTIS